MTLSQGDRLGRYEILASIGAGGMGEVWRARDTELDREVAVKVLPPKVADSPDRRKRFEREARATAALNHPNLLMVFDVGLDEGRPYLVTELLEGETLRRMLRHGPPPPASAVAWSLEIAQGLAAAHSRNVVHRDLKPDNVFLTTDNRVKILDFGLAKILETEIADEDETAALSSDTAAGTLLGTMGYMAPEQLRGDPVDTRTDVFAFGCVLYEMLSGRRPFAGGSSADYVSAALRDDPAPLEDSLSVSLRAIVRRCLEKRPAARYQGAGELVAVLETLDPDSLGAVSGTQSAPPIAAARSGTEPAVAVMPFANLSNDDEQEYFCDGMTEEILGAIGKVRGLKVLARSSSFAFKGREADPREVGRTIGADHLLEGSVRRAGDRVRISARLVQATDGTQLWADHYDRTISDIFELQDEISIEVANQLRTALLPDELMQLKRRHVPDREAHDLFIRGRHLWYRRAEGDMMQAIKLYERAIEIDPGYAEPHVGIAEVFMVLGMYSVMPSKAAFGRVRQEVTIALELDEELASAHGVRGFVATYCDLDFGAGEQHLTRAIALDETSAHFHCWLSTPLALQGRVEESLDHVRQALRVEPMSAIVQTLAGFNMVFGDPERGLHHLWNGFEMQPDNPLTGLYLGVALGEFLGRFEEAIPPLEHSASRGWLYSLALLTSYNARLGNLEKAAHFESQIEKIPKTRYVTPLVRALVAAGYGRADETLDALETCLETGDWLGFLRMFRRTFGFILDNPRTAAVFQDLGGQLGS
jgi:TolB-like protein